MRHLFVVGTLALLLCVSGCGTKQTELTGETRVPALSATSSLPQGQPKPTTTKTTAPRPVTKPASTAKTFSIAIKNGLFSPNIVYVERGTIVTWINYDGSSHTVSGDNVGLSSPLLTAGKKYSFTFNEIGTFSYHDSKNIAAKGTVVVTPAQ